MDLVATWMGNLWPDRMIASSIGAQKRTVPGSCPGTVLLDRKAGRFFELFGEEGRLFVIGGSDQSEFVCAGKPFDGGFPPAGIRPIGAGFPIDECYRAPATGIFGARTLVVHGDAPCKIGCNAGVEGVIGTSQDVDPIGQCFLPPCGPLYAHAEDGVGLFFYEIREGAEGSTAFTARPGRRPIRRPEWGGSFVPPLWRLSVQPPWWQTAENGRACVPLRERHTVPL